MKALGFLISLLVHLLFLLLLLQVRFPMIEIPVKAQIIQVVPMSPPPAVEPPAPRPVYVRPFVLKGGAPGRAGLRRGSGRQPASSRSRSRRAAAPIIPSAFCLPAPAGRPPGPSRAARGNGARLTVDLDRLSRMLKEKSQAPGQDSGGAGLPFG